MAEDATFTLMIEGFHVKYTAAGRENLPPLILVHGWGSHRGVWRQTIPALEASFHCVAVDLLGFGDSDKPPQADYGIAAQGRRIVQITDQLGFDRFALAGHSMGGQIALYTAAELAPERITKAVSVAGVVTGKLSPIVERSIYTQIALARLLPGLHTIARRLNHYRWYALPQFRPWFYHMDAVPFEDWAIDRYMFNHPGIHVSLYKAGRAIHQMNLTSYLERIQAATLILFGQQDGTVPVSDAHLAAQKIPGSRLVLIDRCGHFPMYEQPQQYREALLSFLCN